ncbi:MAG: porin, partial [Bdellovibrionales bacterium]
MRKILLATTALVAFAGAAQAAESPIQVTLGGSVDFRAALFHESNKSALTGETRRDGDFQTEYDLTIAAEGKAANGIEYGALIDIDNDRDDSREGRTPTMEQAYVWMSGAFGKVLMGDEHGASDLFVYAPTVGEGQIDGSYTNFTDTASLAQFQPVYFDATENYTKFTYYTPKVGNANHKVQLGASFAPNVDQGSNTALYDS